MRRHASARLAAASLLGAGGARAGTLIEATWVRVAQGLSVFNVGVNTLLAVPLSHGMGGQFTTTFTGLTSKGVALPDAMGEGRFTLIPSSFQSSIVTLVAPSKVSINGPLAQRRTASFTKLTLFFPEPRTWLLFGAAALGMACVARRRRS